MANTYSSIIDEILINLNGYTMRQDRTTHLTSAITSSDTVLPFSSITNIGKGIVEIDDELIWLDTYDRVSSTGSVPPYGRGYQGTTAASHTSGTKVTVSPTFPRVMVKKAIEDTIEASFPHLFSVEHTTLTYQAAKSTYSLPADIQWITQVSWQTTGPSGEWLPVKGWRHDSMANHTAYTTGNTIGIYDRITPGRTVNISYARKPQKMVNTTDVFEDTTGLPTSCKDVIVYGATYRLLQFIDPARLNYSSAEADLNDTKLQYGSGASSARFLLAMYQQRLNEEADKLRDAYQTRIHYTRY